MFRHGSMCLSWLVLRGTFRYCSVLSLHVLVPAGAACCDVSRLRVLYCLLRLHPLAAAVLCPRGLVVGGYYWGDQCLLVIQGLEHVEELCNHRAIDSLARVESGEIRNEGGLGSHGPEVRVGEAERLR